MDGYATYMLRHAKNDDFSIDFAIFTKALPTDRRTDGPTDRRTDIPSYRDAIAASINDDDDDRKAVFLFLFTL